jgi:EAL domain-containing protein (putative c-di-GMP-specific phosphodiesterase class I)
LELFLGQYDAQYFAKLYQISQTHVRIDLPNHYVNTALHVVRSFLRDLLIKNNKIHALCSVDKIIDIHIDALSGLYSDIEQVDILQTIHVMNTALKDNAKGVVPYTQAIINTKTLHVEKYECLMRLIVDGEITMPLKFLDIAKKTGIYCDLSRAMMGHVFNHYAQNQTSFSININFDDLKSCLTKKFLQEQLTKIDNPSRITFEILESQSLSDMSLLADFITLIRSYGCLIAIDDFGTGYSNFNHIMSLSPDILKIDGSLIKDIDQNFTHQAIVENINSLAHKLGIITVAEYVHSELIMSKVCELGIDFAQGYHLGMPLPLNK